MRGRCAIADRILDSTPPWNSCQDSETPAMTSEHQAACNNGHASVNVCVSVVMIVSRLGMAIHMGAQCEVVCPVMSIGRG